MIDLPVTHNNTDAVWQRFGELVLAEMWRLKVPGVAAGLWHDGREHLTGFGVTSVENPLPVTADTLFQIGSITKTITGTVIMRLVEQRRLDLDAPVKTYLPDFTLQDKATEAAVTLRHCLTHMGGWAGDYFRETGSGDDALARYVDELHLLPQLAPLDTLWAYNNAGFGIAGRVIEVVTGQSYEATARELVLEPLSMDGAFFLPEEVISRRFAVGHRVDAGNGRPAVLRPWALARASNAIGGLYAGVRDMLRYARLHLGNGTMPDGQRLLQSETLADMQYPHRPANLGRMHGLSWALRTVGGEKLVTHGGATKGQQAICVMVPAHDFALIVLTNSEDGSLLYEAAVEWALDHYLGLVEPQPEHLPATPGQLEGYAGLYEAQLQQLELSVVDGQLMAQSIPKGGFPDVSSPPGPKPPPSRLAVIGDDKVIALDPPLINQKMEFLRDADGKIIWLRTSRLHRRSEPDDQA